LSSSRKQQCPQTDLNKEQSLLWHRILHQNGWIAPLWAARRRSKDEELSQDEIAFYDAFGGACYLISSKSTSTTEPTRRSQSSQGHGARSRHDDGLSSYPKLFFS